MELSADFSVGPTCQSGRCDHVIRTLLHQEALGSPPYSLLAIVLGVSFLAFGSSVRQWLRRSATRPQPPSSRRFWIPGVALGGPLVLAIAQATAYYFLLPMREASWPWFAARFGPWGAPEWESLAWAVTESCVALLVTSLAAFGVGRYAGRAGLVEPLDGYWLANPLSALAILMLFAAAEPAVRSDLERWGPAAWLTRLFIVVPIYAWCFHAGARRRNNALELTKAAQATEPRR